jgi:hypothetical protein
MKRRRVVKSCAGATAGGVAVLGSGSLLGWSPYGIGFPDSPPPSGDPSSIQDPLKCEEKGMQRVQQEFEEAELRYGTARSAAGVPVFKITADKQEVSRGETVNITFENVSRIPKKRGPKSKHNLQVLTKDGWQDVRVWTDGPTIHPSDQRSWPGETLKWSIKMTKQEATDTLVLRTELAVCPGLPIGRYRFVSAGHSLSDSAVGVQFDLVE